MKKKNVISDFLCGYDPARLSDKDEYMKEECRKQYVYMVGDDLIIYHYEDAFSYRKFLISGCPYEWKGKEYQEYKWTDGYVCAQDAKDYCFDELLDLSDTYWTEKEKTSLIKEYTRMR